MTHILEETNHIIESIEKCPECGGRLAVRINREPQQKSGWAVYHCLDCLYWGQSKR